MEALQRADAATYAGKSDWRLPKLQELLSIVEEACYDPAIDLAVFPGTSSSWYWSSSPFAYHSAFAWYVLFNDGDDGSDNESNAYQVRLVRGGQ